MELRKYQKECLYAIRKAWEREGLRRILVSMATGAGKTAVFSQLPSRIPMRGKKMLVLAHREELLDQAASHIKRFNPSLSVGIEQGNRYAGDCDVIVASVQSLQKDRLESIDPSSVGVIVQDECHHARVFHRGKNNKTYQSIFEHFHVMDGDVRLLGVTATPNRADGSGLWTLFEDVVYHCGIDELIEDGWLVPIRAYSVQSDCDISDVRTSMGDFVVSQLSAAVNKSDRNALVVESYKEFLEGRQVIVFCVDVKHSLSVAERFREAGIAAQHVDGKTPTRERDNIMKGFRAGEFPVLTNVGICTEGIDAPICSGIIMARPTKSEVFFQQAIGRGTRLYPNTSVPLTQQEITKDTKTDLIVVDICDNAGRHSIMSVPGMFGLPQDAPIEGKQLHRVTGIVKKLFGTDSGQIQLETEDADIISKVINMFAGHNNAMRKKSSYAWFEPLKGEFIICPSNRTALMAVQDKIGKWKVVIAQKVEENYTPRIESAVVIESGDLMEVVRKTDRIIYEIASQTPLAGEGRGTFLTLCKKNAQWRRKPPSSMQKGFLENLIKRRCDLDVDVDFESLTKGDVSDWISFLVWSNTPARLRSMKPFNIRKICNRRKHNGKGFRVQSVPPSCVGYIEEIIWE